LGKILQKKPRAKTGGDEKKTKAGKMAATKPLGRRKGQKWARRIGIFLGNRKQNQTAEQEFQSARTKLTETPVCTGPNTLKWARKKERGDTALDPGGSKKNGNFRTWSQRT